MFSRTITAAAALAAAVAVSVAVHRYRSLHRVLTRERAAHRLMDGCLHRDFAAFRSRVDAAAARLEAERAVEREAGLVVDRALAVHGARPNDPHNSQDPYEEGGPV